jgi:hypothetical protein
MMSSQPFFVKLKPGQDHVRRALDTVDAPYTVLPLKLIHESSFPPASGFPFFVLNTFIPQVMLKGGSSLPLTIWDCLALPYR